ncbi:MAG: hypothetical protein HY034_02220 [Nitrospirae bacterium]|nr:hypothetical protein [Nitrospirota bacterium]
MPKITIDIPITIEKDIPKNKKELTRIFLLGFKREKAYGALQRFKKLKGALKKAYPDVTSVELQHRAQELW